MKDINFQTHDLSFAAFLLTKGWHVQSVSEEAKDPKAKKIIFLIPGWDSLESASQSFQKDIPLPSRSLLKNYHYVKNLVTKRQKPQVLL